MGLRVGSLVLSTNQGLGLLAKSFFDAGVVTDPVIVRHGARADHPEWFPGSGPVYDPGDSGAYPGVLERLLKCDVCLFFETPFRWRLLDDLRGRVPTFLMVMYECEPDPLPAEPDYFLCPSLLDWRHFPSRSFHVPVPVEDYFVGQWRRRGPVTTFVHNAGNGGLRGRNGTREVLGAWPLLESPARLVLRSQVPVDLPGGGRAEEGVTLIDYPSGATAAVHVGDAARGTLYQTGECFLYPERFNGLSLPLQEAFASGMLVCATDRYPNTTYLPRRIEKWSDAGAATLNIDGPRPPDEFCVNPLIPVDHYRKARVSPRCREFDEAVVTAEAVAALADELYGVDLGPYSELGREWGRNHTWSALRDRYLGVLSHGRDPGAPPAPRP